ncbi:hypothetical protein A6X21_10460 [Planctopirus hydrillae]|uniref:Uncharacterized protein n=1 Tax=Planctopirus hydrillae TaxID=1841610 RepID=A0A1C3E6P1_9PLAN|nr:hypothetical protein A6X21_10460 [Planctopirus hydrillae]
MFRNRFTNGWKAKGWTGIDEYRQVQGHKAEMRGEGKKQNSTTVRNDCWLMIKNGIDEQKGTRHGTRESQQTRG